MPPKPPIRMPMKSTPLPRRPPPLAKPLPTLRAPPTPPKPPNNTIPPPLPPRTPFSAPRFTLRSTLNWTLNTIVAGCFLLWTRDHYLDWFSVNGASMAPTINPDVHETGRRDWIVMQPLSYRARAEKDGDMALKRGDVVTFWKPRRPEEVSIKRVVGLEGDEVYVGRGYAVEEGVGEGRLQGVADGLADEDDDSVASWRTKERGKIVVPYGHVWLEGDNAEKSLDSRDFGPVSRGLIEARAIWIWRGWGDVRRVGDGRSVRERKGGSRVVEGRMDVPSMFLD